MLKHITCFLKSKSSKPARGSASLHMNVVLLSEGSVNTRYPFWKWVTSCVFGIYQHKILIETSTQEKFLWISKQNLYQLLMNVISKQWKNSKNMLAFTKDAVNEFITLRKVAQNRKTCLKRKSCSNVAEQNMSRPVLGAGMIFSLLFGTANEQLLDAHCSKESSSHQCPLTLLWWKWSGGKVGF